MLKEAEHRAGARDHTLSQNKSDVCSEGLQPPYDRPNIMANMPLWGRACEHHRCLCTCINRLTNRWEASLWLNGRQLYLGGFTSEEDAAKAYDLVALSCKGLHVATNFDQSTYSAELVELGQSSQVRCWC